MSHSELSIIKLLCFISFRVYLLPSKYNKIENGINLYVEFLQNECCKTLRDDEFDLGSNLKVTQLIMMVKYRK